MQMINVPKLRMAQLQTFTEGVLKTTTNLAEVAPQVADVKAKLTVFLDGMTKATASSNKSVLDRTRDELNSGFFKGVESEQLFPHAADVAKLLSQVVGITSRYGFGLNRLSYDEQTAQTDNMIKELEVLKLNKLPNISRWLAPMKAANAEFKSLAEAYYKDLTAAGETSAASHAAPALTDAINALFTMLFAHVQISGSETLTTAYKELITQVESFK